MRYIVADNSKWASEFEPADEEKIRELAKGLNADFIIDRLEMTGKYSTKVLS